MFGKATVAVGWRPREAAGWSLEGRRVHTPLSPCARDAPPIDRKTTSICLYVVGVIQRSRYWTATSCLWQNRRLFWAYVCVERAWGHVKSEWIEENSWLVLVMSRLRTTLSFESDLFSDLVEPIHRTGLSDWFTNWTDPSERLTNQPFIDSLKQELSDSYWVEIYKFGEKLRLHDIE